MHFPLTNLRNVVYRTELPERVASDWMEVLSAFSFVLSVSDIFLAKMVRYITGDDTRRYLVVSKLARKYFCET